MNALHSATIKISFTLFFAVATNLVFSMPSKDRKDNTGKTSKVEIQGRILVKNKELKGAYTVEVLCFNSITESIQVKNNESLKLHLYANAAYLLKITKKGFVPRYISLNTHQMVDNKESYSFYVETDFIEISEAMRMDSEDLEMPSAIISFNRSTGNLDNNLEYNSYVHQRITLALNPEQQ